MSLEKFRALLDKSAFERTSEDITEMEQLLKNRDIRFTQYFYNENGQDLKTDQFNNIGNFLHFVSNTNYPNGELILLATENRGNVYVPSSYIEF